MPVAQRGIDLELQRGWEHAIQKQEFLRLKWFRRNEQRLNEIANKPISRAVPEEKKKEFEQQLIESYQNVQKFPNIRVNDAEPIDPRAYQCIMKPVDPAVEKLIYTGTNQDGRVNYLNQRIKLIPDQRYYFPEVSSFIYGWKMWDYVKGMKKTGFGRRAVIRDSFYRRRGVTGDPEWYKEPAMYSPTICNCN